MRLAEELALSWTFGILAKGEPAMAIGEATGRWRRTEGRGLEGRTKARGLAGTSTELALFEAIRFFANLDFGDAVMAPGESTGRWRTDAGGLAGACNSVEI